MNKEEFKAYTKDSISDPYTIVKLMELIYESDIANFFPKNMWSLGNPFFLLYNDFYDKNDYSETSEKRIYYKNIIKDVKSTFAFFPSVKQNIMKYFSHGSYLHVPKVYKNNNNTNGQ